METPVPIRGSDLLKVVKEAQPKQIDPELQREQFVASLSDHNGWVVMKEYIESEMERLKALGGTVDPQMTVEQIGFKYLAIQLALEHLQNVIDTVSAHGQINRDTRDS